jgi:hypothetical protein
MITFSIEKIRKVNNILTLDCPRVSGIVESNLFNDQLKNKGLSGMIFQVTKNTKICQEFFLLLVIVIIE